MTDNPNLCRSRRRPVVGSSKPEGAATLLAAAGSASPAEKGDERFPLPADKKPLKVAFLIDEDATVIDFCGPWEVFEDAEMADVPGFELFTVAPTTSPITATGGMKIVPDYSLASAPSANIIVIPAQRGGHDPKGAGDKPEWLRSRRSETDVIMSVCTGAFLLARSGLLDGLNATTHHLFYDSFEGMFPKVKLLRNVRIVDNGSIMSTAGLSSGIDGALHLVERYYGAESAVKTAQYMEYRRSA
jgi:transcriptional regulator GlxA family with amidase domain